MFSFNLILKKKDLVEKKTTKMRMRVLLIDFCLFYLKTLNPRVETDFMKIKENRSWGFC